MSEKAPSGRANGLIVAAPSSGSGKTVLTLGLLRALRNRGVKVSSLKIGPDYIDPAYHAAATGRPTANLDLWAMRPSTIAGLVGFAGQGADLILAEGVMGLFDGAADGSGSTADAAAVTGWPVLLIVDVRGQGASAAAVVRGFRDHRPDVTIAGVIFNRGGGNAHRDILERAMRGIDIPILGFLPREPTLAVDSRHLGLKQAGEHSDLDGWIEASARIVAEHVDLARIVSLARPARTVSTLSNDVIAPLGKKIAVARDEAFAFSYPHLLAGWEGQGAELAFFSPLADEAPDSAADAIYLPGGYPELHADRLAANSRFLDGVRAGAARKAAIYGECGGYMVLGRSITDADGKPHTMAGLLPVESSFVAPKLHLGYRRLTLATDCALGATGHEFRGHEFHYATASADPAVEPLFRASDAQGKSLAAMGCRVGSVSGSFAHLLDRA
jgi:cobyrinic acid a,c-diamide synthase